MFTYHQRTGKLLKDGVEIATGYSGNGAGKNNPDMQEVHRVGPIPRGRYTIGAPYDSKNVGPYALPLVARTGTQSFGRDAFRMHGDSIAHPGEASKGCIIMPRAIRLVVVRSGDRDLEVVV